MSTYRIPQFNKVPLLKQDTDLESHDALANGLLLLGLYDEAIPEYLAARKSSRGPDEDYTIAVLSCAAGLPNRAVRFGEQTWKTVPADFVVELAPREMVQLLYPTPFRESLLKHTREQERRSAVCALDCASGVAFSD